MDQLLVAGGNADMVDHGHCTAFMIAVEHEKELVVERLLEHGCNVGIVDNNNNTALIHAVHFENESLICILKRQVYKTADTYQDNSGKLASNTDNVFNISSQLIIT